MHALKAHLADIAYQMGTKNISNLTQADSKLIAEHQKAAHDLTKRKRQERQVRRKLINKQKKLERELEYLNFPTIMVNKSFKFIFKFSLHLILVIIPRVGTLTDFLPRTFN